MDFLNDKLREIGRSAGIF